MPQPIKPKSAITPESFNRLAYDVGILFANYGEIDGDIPLGVTRGGVQFVVETSFRKMPMDGSPGDVKGDKRIESDTAKIVGNFLEMTTANMLKFLPGATSIVDGGSDKITRSCQIAPGDYIKNLTLVVSKTGTEECIAVQISNALCTSGFDFSAAENDETVITGEFIAHHDPENLDISPWAIWNPLEVPVVTHTLTYTDGLNGTINGDLLQTVVDGEDGTVINANPDAGFVFDQWSDTSTDNPRQDTAVTGDISVTAIYISI